jgi:hypothetical protein
MTPRLTLGAVAVTLLAGLGVAAAQQPHQAPAEQPARAAQPSTEGRAPPGDGQMQQQHNQAQEAVHSKSGQAGKEEPGSHIPTAKPTGEPAPKDTQTTPAKFSARNAALDKIPIMALPLPLNDEQKRRIYDSVSEAQPSPDSDSVEPAHVLPSSVVLRELPKGITEEIPAVRTLHYARFANKVLLVRAPNRIVVGVIEK